MKTTTCTVRRRTNGGCLFVLLFIASNTMAFAGKPPVVSTKPIDYRIQYFTAPNSGPVASFEDMNESGAVVGNYFTDSTHVSGYLYDPLLSVSSAINLHSQYLLPAGWYITYPRSINNFGVIVAIVWHATEGERAMLLNPNGTQDQATGKRLATWLPDLAGSERTFPKKINDQGDILLCAYFSTGEYVPYVYSPGINGSTEYGPTELGFNVFDSMNMDMSSRLSGEPLRFAGVLPGGNESFHYTMGGPLKRFPMQTVSVFAINSHGTFCGRQAFSTIGRGGKLTWSSQTFRFNPSTDTAVTSLGTSGKYALDINDSNDVATNSKFLIHSIKGTLDLNTLVVGSSADVNYFKTGYSFESLLTQRTGNGFPVMGLKVGDLGCILVPSVPPQP